MTAPRILVADDEPLLLAELVEALERLWPEAQVATARRLARRSRPDLS